MAAQKDEICRRLEDQAIRIEEILARCGMSAVITGGVVRAESLDYWVQVLDGEFARGVEVVEREIAAVLGVPHVQIACQEEQITVRVMIIASNSQPPKLLELIASVTDEQPMRMIFGVSGDGRPLLLNLKTADVSNILVVGNEGTGKTSLLRSMLFSLAARNKQHQFQAVVIDFDPEGQPGRLAAFSYLPHLVNPVASSLPEAIQALDFLIRELDYRQNNDVTYPKIILAVNNLDELLAEGQRALLNRLICLLQYGAEAGIHIILSLAYPGGEFVDTVLKCGFPLRFIGRVENEKLARAAAGVSDTGAHMLVGMGDFVAVYAGQMVRFRVAEIGDYDLFLAVEKLSRQKKQRMLARTADFPLGFLGTGI